MWHKFYILIVSLSATCFASGQHVSDTATDKTVKATNFSLPSSVAFNLLDVNPSQVHRPGFAKDFKFDWLVKDNKLVSNIAVEAQPIWLLAYRNTDYRKLVKQKAFERALSSLSVSLGTASKDSLRSLAWGAKINLYASKNPIYDTAYINRIGRFFTGSQLESAYLAKQLECDNSRLNADQKKKCQKELDSLKKAYDQELEAHLKSIDKFREEYEKDNWNSTIIDLGFGRLHNYLTASVDSLSFNGAGGGVWLSGNFGIGKKVLINGMVKYTEIRDKPVTSIGANLRYGGLNANFFVEGVYNASSADNLEKIVIAYGGDIKLKAFALQFGLRTEYNKNMKFRNLVPAVNFNYLLNQ